MVKAYKSIAELAEIQKTEVNYLINAEATDGQQNFVCPMPPNPTKIGGGGTRREASSRLVGQGPQWALEPKD